MQLNYMDSLPVVRILLIMAVIDLYEPVSDSIEATTGSTSQISYRPITSQTSTSKVLPEVLVCDVIGRNDICEVLPVVASIESETGSYKSITALFWVTKLGLGLELLPAGQKLCQNAAGTCRII